MIIMKMLLTKLENPSKIFADNYDAQNDDDDQNGDNDENDNDTNE